MNPNKTNSSRIRRNLASNGQTPPDNRNRGSSNKRGTVSLERSPNKRDDLGQRRRVSTGDDSFLSQYIKSLEIQTTLNDHQLYFKALEKQRKVKSLEVYQKYLNSNKKVEHERNYKQYLTSKISPRLQRRDVSPLEHSNKDTTTSSTSTITTKPAEDDRIKKTSKVTVSEPQKRKPPATHITHQLPLEFMECPIDYLIDLISRMLQSLITLNDKSVPRSISNPPASSSTATPTAAATTATSSTSNGSQSSNNLLTRYHSRTPPAISAYTYLSRLSKFNNFNPAILLTTIYYIDLLSHQYQPFFTLNSWTVHRFLLVATMIAQKSLEDFFYTNDHYAKVGGVALGELNCLELDFLNRVDWRCVPGKQVLNKVSGVICTNIGQAKDVLDLYYSQLIDLMGKNTQYGNHNGDESQSQSQSQSQRLAVCYVKEQSGGHYDGETRRNVVRTAGGTPVNGEDVDEYISEDGDGDGYEEEDDDDDEEDDDEDDEEDVDDDDDEEDDEDEEGDYDEDEEHDNLRGVVNGNAQQHSEYPHSTPAYDENGFIRNGFSSPHLKRRYGGSPSPE
ncbi:PHO80 [Candida theae]|uniref:PHO80 n=1 Tax=Candida theae TaxID=1198502 RepID=A0AAD5BGX7_9ASCO|nr:PHO80 [Candida theae]KAI5961321.1 PHO80 [Candida theae]